MAFINASSRKSETQRRRLAAYNFLSNISLDGTHRDTKYKIFNKRGLGNCEHLSSGKRSQKSSCSDSNKHPNGDGNEGRGISNSNQIAKENEAPHQIKEKLSPSAGHNRGRSISMCEPMSEEEDNEEPDVLTRRKLPFRRRYCSTSEDESGVPATVRERLSSLSSRVRQKSLSSSLSSVCTTVGAGRVTVTDRPAARLHRNPNSRVILLSAQRGPIMVYSALPYTRKPHTKELHENTNKRVPSSTQLPAHPDSLLSYTVTESEGQDRSYGHLLVPSRYRTFLKKMGSVDGGSLYPIVEASHTTQASPVEFDVSGSIVYNPNLLDDPELRSGKHRTLMTFPSYVTSIIDYVRPSELKSELNEKFRERFPNIQLTLSKLRSLKHDMFKIGRMKCNLEVLIIAESYVFFEKVILKGLINKPNRKMVAGACLLLAAKLNDIKGPDLTKLIEEIEDTFKLQRRDLVSIEFGVLLALEFGLHVPDSEINTHYQRLMYNN